MSTLYGPHTEAIETNQSKSFIEHVLSRLGPQVKVVGSCMTEDGWTLILQGPKRQVMDVYCTLYEADSEEMVVP